ncbi:MAG: hypothetical protein NZ866_02040 [Patescibacteria group bacterium]|nr:hypothetical protein [Patescibacteria group bacterium]
MNLSSDKNHKSLFIIVFLLIDLIIFVILIFYFLKVIDKKLPEDILIYKIKKEILTNISDWKYEQLNNIRIAKNLNIYNDENQELLVDLVGLSGAAVNIYFLFKLENNQPKLIKFKMKDGKINNFYLSEGSGGAGRYGFSYRIFEKEGIVYQGSYFAYGTNDDNCQVNTYIYNKRENILEYNEEFSKKYQKEYCQKVCVSIPEEIRNYFLNICQ